MRGSFEIANGHGTRGPDFTERSLHADAISFLTAMAWTRNTPPADTRPVPSTTSSNPLGPRAKVAVFTSIYLERHTQP